MVVDRRQKWAQGIYQAPYQRAGRYGQDEELSRANNKVMTAAVMTSYAIPASSPGLHGDDIVFCINLWPLRIEPKAETLLRAEDRIVAWLLSMRSGWSLLL